MNKIVPFYNIYKQRCHNLKVTSVSVSLFVFNVGRQILWVIYSAN